MEIGTRCHICGFVSINPRCPRCNALKLASCTGSCMICRNKKSCDSQKIAIAAASEPELGEKNDSCGASSED